MVLIAGGSFGHYWLGEQLGKEAEILQQILLLPILVSILLFIYNYFYGLKNPKLTLTEDLIKAPKGKIIYTKYNTIHFSEIVGVKHWNEKHNSFFKILSANKTILISSPARLSKEEFDNVIEVVMTNIPESCKKDLPNKPMSMNMIFILILVMYSFIIFIIHSKSKELSKLLLIGFPVLVFLGYFGKKGRKERRPWWWRKW